MGNCFVIQPFDKDKFDKRFNDHFAPAIRKAGLEPYRVDRDPSVRIPIESIHEGIGEAVACLADITTDNPNVWYELGHALACHKEVVLVCSVEREAFPFDIRHLNIIRYSSSSGSDFLKLEKQITEQLKARLVERKNLQTIASMSPLKEVQGLSPHETATLTVLMSNALTPDSSVSPWELKQEMEKVGFTPIAINLSVESLLRKKMISIIEDTDYNDNPVKLYRLEDSGSQWLLHNQDKLILRKNTPQSNGFYPEDDYDTSDPFADQ